MVGTQVPRRRRSPKFAAVALVVAVVLSACQTPPLANPTGTRTGLAATSTGDRAKARTLIAGVATAPASSRTDYVRSKFGSGWLDSISPTVPFARNGCDARNDILARDLTGETFKAGTNDCVVMSGNLTDPYSGKKISFVKANANAVQIDHVIPLSYAWKSGAAGWSDAKRRDFANDPLNLLAVDGPTNGSKGDKGPARWLPPVVNVRCSYSVRFAQVSKKYALPVTPADKSKMAAQCA